MQNPFVRWPSAVRCRLAICLFMAMLSLHTWSPGAVHSEELDVKKVRRAVVLIKLSVLGRTLSTGTGFLASADGVIYTNRHVVAVDGLPDRAATLLVGVPSQNDPDILEYFVASLIFYPRHDASLDFAVLKIAARDGRQFPTLPMATKPGDLGDSVAVIGFPLASERDPNVAFNRGSISSKRTRIMDRSYYQTDAAVNPGNSGGPFLNSSGEVLGIVTLKRSGADNIGYALYTDEIKTTLEGEARAIASSRPAAGPIDPEQLVHAAPQPGPFSRPSPKGQQRPGQPKDSGSKDFGPKDSEPEGSGVDWAFHSVRANDVTRKYQAARKKLRESYQAEQKKNRDALIANLEAAEKGATKTADLDEALTIRDAIKTFRASAQDEGSGNAPVAADNKKSSTGKPDFKAFLAKVNVESAGYDNGDRAVISIDEETIFGPGGKEALRGLNVVVFRDGKVTMARNYDTWGSPQDALQFFKDITALPAGSFVIVAVRDSTRQALNRPVDAALVKIGSRAGLQNKPDRASYLCIGYKGLGKGKAVEKAALGVVRYSSDADDAAK